MVFCGSIQLIPDSEGRGTQTSVGLRPACFTKRVRGLHSENLASERARGTLETKTDHWNKKHQIDTNKDRALGAGGSSQAILKWSMIGNSWETFQNQRGSGGYFGLRQALMQPRLTLKLRQSWRWLRTSDPPPPPECWNDRHVLLYPASVVCGRQLSHTPSPLAGLL